MKVMYQIFGDFNALTYRKTLRLIFLPNMNPIMVIATWVSDQKYRRSMGEIIMMLARAAAYYRTQLQSTVAQSLIEVEFTNMVDTGIATIYLKWIFEEL